MILPFWFHGDENFDKWLDASRGIIDMPEYKKGLEILVQGPFIVSAKNGESIDWINDTKVFHDLRISSYGELSKAVVFSSYMKVHVFEVLDRVRSFDNQITFRSPVNGDITIRALNREDIPSLKKFTNEKMSTVKDVVRAYFSGRKQT